MSELATAAVQTTAAPPERRESKSGGTSRRWGPAKVINYTMLVLVVLVYLYPLVFLINTALKSNG